MFYHSELVESDDIDRLDVILESFNHLLDEISGDLVVFDGGTDLDLEDSESNGLLLPLSFPEKTIHLDSKNLVSESVKISLLTPWLDFPNDKGLGDGAGLLDLSLVGLGSLALCLHGSGGSGISLGILSEGIELILFGGSSGLRGGLLTFGGFASLTLQQKKCSRLTS